MEDQCQGVGEAEPLDHLFGREQRFVAAIKGLVVEGVPFGAHQQGDGEHLGVGEAEVELLHGDVEGVLVLFVDGEHLADVGEAQRIGQEPAMLRGARVAVGDGFEEFAADTLFVPLGELEQIEAVLDAAETGVDPRRKAQAVPAQEVVEEDPFPDSDTAGENLFGLQVP